MKMQVISHPPTRHAIAITPKKVKEVVKINRGKKKSERKKY